MTEKPSKSYFIFMTILFLSSIIIYFFIGLKYPSLVSSVLTQNLPDLSAFVNNTPLENFALIFFNNITKSLAVIIGGIIFGVFPIYFIFINGQIIGMVTALVYIEGGIMVVLSGLLPHGVTETIAIILSGGYGLWLGLKFFKAIFFKEKVEFRNALYYSLRKYVRVIVPLFLISAIIEAFVTPHVLGLFNT